MSSTMLSASIQDTRALSAPLELVASGKDGCQPNKLPNKYFM